MEMSEREKEREREYLASRLPRENVCKRREGKLFFVRSYAHGKVSIVQTHIAKGVS